MEDRELVLQILKSGFGIKINIIFTRCLCYNNRNLGVDIEGRNSLPKISVDNIKPGMKLSKPVVNKAGMILLGEKTLITGIIIERLKNTGITSVYVEGDSKPKKPVEEVMSEIDKRFRKTENEPYMYLLKRVLKKHIEELYNYGYTETA